MMKREKIEREKIVAAVVQAAGGSLTSRVRLQKTVYLLDRLGLNSGFSFEYYHYGPYSRDLDNATADAEAFGLVEETFAHRDSDGARYSIFALKVGAEAIEASFGDMDADRAGEAAKRFAKTNVTVLELAATIDWLWKEEKIADWRGEVKKRKGSKIGQGRLERAIELLCELGLQPPAQCAG